MKGNFVDKHDLDELVNDSRGNSFFNYVCMCVYAHEYNDMNIKKGDLELQEVVNHLTQVLGT